MHTDVPRDSDAVRCYVAAPNIALDDGFAAVEPAAVSKLTRLQADLAEAARNYAAEAAGLGAQEMAGPLNELVQHLRDVVREAENAERLGGTPAANVHTIERALYEAERVYAMMAGLGSLETRLPEGGRGVSPSRRSKLTPREAEVLDLITRGVSNKEGGYRLGISMRTFEVHRAHIMRKMGARNAADLVRLALGVVGL